MSVHYIQLLSTNRALKIEGLYEQEFKLLGNLCPLFKCVPYTHGTLNQRPLLSCVWEAPFGRYLDTRGFAVLNKLGGMGYRVISVNNAPEQGEVLYTLEMGLRDFL